MFVFTREKFAYVCRECGLDLNFHAQKQLNRKFTFSNDSYEITKHLRYFLDE